MNPIEISHIDSKPANGIVFWKNVTREMGSNKWLHPTYDRTALYVENRIPYKYVMKELTLPPIYTFPIPYR